MNFDLVIKHGLVFDGSGNPGFHSNIYINNGKIEKITRLNLGTADEAINAKGLAVAPGFIDIHQHSDYTIFGVPKCDSFIHQGVTTVTVGHCGLSLAPLRSEFKDDLLRYNEAFTLDFDVPYNWHSFGEHLDAIAKVEPGVNIWPQVGHGTLRAAIMGYAGRNATDRELNEMKELLDQSMMEGAHAMSIGWYAPAFWADSHEIIELAKIVAKHDGILMAHLRASPYWTDEVFTIGEMAGISVEIAHYDGTGIQVARARGIDVTYDSYAYLAGSSLLGQVLPVWMYEDGVNVMLERVSDSKIRDKIKEESTDYDWNQAVIAYLSKEQNKPYEGSSIGNIARAENSDPIDMVCDLLLEEEGKGMYIIMNGRKESYIFNNLKDPNNYIMSDGWGLAPYAPIKRGIPHPRAYGAFPRVLGRYVRDCEIIPLQEAIRKMTWGPAQKLGITDRGLLRAGMAADVVVFNPTTILDTATFDDPHQFPIGIEFVLVNGQITINEGEHTEKRAGMII